MIPSRRAIALYLIIGLLSFSVVESLGQVTDSDPRGSGPPGASFRQSIKYGQKKT